MDKQLQEYLCELHQQLNDEDYDRACEELFYDDYLDEIRGYEN